MSNVSSKKKLLIILGIAVVILAIPLTYLLTQQTQDLRQRAAERGSRGEAQYCGGHITGCVNQYTQVLRIADTCQSHETRVLWGDGENRTPTVLGCINQYTQVVRFPTVRGGAGAQCQDHEIPRTWSKGNPGDRQVRTCVSNYTGLARVTDRQCNDQETLLSWSTNITCTEGPTPTSTPRPTRGPSPTPAPQATPTTRPTGRPRVTPTITPTPTGRIGGQPTPTTTPTPTRTPTAQPSPTPTLVPSTTPGQNEATLVLQLKMPGIGNLEGDNQSPQNSIRQAGMEILNTQNANVGNTTIPVQFDGQIFKGSGNVGLASGTYYANVKLDNTLYSVTGVFQLTPNTTSTLQLITLVPGDLDQNNILDIRDYNIFISCVGDKQCTQKELADFNDDGEVDPVDYNILLRSFAIRQGS